MVEQGGADEEAPAVGVRPGLAAVHDQGRAGGHSRVDVADDAVPGRSGDQRTHVAAAPTVAGAQSERALGDPGHQLVPDRPDREDGGDGHAAFPGRAEPGVDRLIGGDVEVGVREHDHVVLGAAEGLHPLAVRGRGLVDVAGDRGRADERHGLDVRVGEQTVDGDLVPVEHVEHPVGQARLGPQPRHPQGRRWHLLTRLEHDRVARGDGDREEPHRHHGREVERADDRHRAQRLPDRGHVDPRRGVLGEPTLEQVWDAAGELDDLLATGHLTPGVGQHLPVLRRDQFGQLTSAGIEQLAEPEQHPGAPGQRGVPPGRERRLGRGDGGVHVGRSGQRQPGGGRTRGRIGDLGGSTARAFVLAAGHPVRQHRDRISGSLGLDRGARSHAASPSGAPRPAHLLARPRQR